MRMHALRLSSIGFWLLLTALPVAALECPAEMNMDIKRLHKADKANPCTLMKTSRAALIVNTASHCGFTKQFTGLESLYQKYKDQGLVVLGFPSDSFRQEEDTEEGTASVCYINYGVTFPMFTHVTVKGDTAHPVFSYLAQQTEKPSWNFNKYLLTSRGITHFGSRTKPLDSDLEQAIAEAVSMAP